MKRFLVCAACVLGCACSGPMALHYRSCEEMWNVYPGGVPEGHDAWRGSLDRDGDGWACDGPMDTLEGRRGR